MTFKNCKLFCHLAIRDKNKKTETLICCPFILQWSLVASATLKKIPCNTIHKTKPSSATAGTISLTLNWRRPNGPCYLICSWHILSFKQSSDQASERLPTMTNKVGLVFLLVMSQNVCKAPSQCSTTDFCSLRSTRGISVYNSSMARRSLYMTCQQACSLCVVCIATTYDSTTDKCHLHEAGMEGTPCMTLVDDERSSFWMIKQPGRSCPKVSCEN